MYKKIDIPVWKKYIEFQDKYSKIYGDDCICLIQAGGFYEVYSTDTYIDSNGDPKPKGFIKKAADAMNINIGQKNISGCPWFSGVPDHAIKKYVSKLVKKNNYIVVMIDHIGPKNSKGGYDRHEVTKILDRSNIDIFFEIDDSNHSQLESNCLLSIFIEEDKVSKGKNVISVGLSVIDLSTGINHIHEIVSKNYDIFEEMYRFIESHNPSEIIIHTRDLETYTKDEIVNRINMNDKLYYYNFYNDQSSYFKLNYQQEFLKKIFPNTGMINVVQYLDLQYRLYALNSYILLLQFAYEHESNIVNKIRVPIIYDENKNLNLYNNALYQLDVVPSNIIKSKYPNKFKSLFDVIFETSTAMGKRELKDRLLNPITNVDELQRRYDMVENMFDKTDKYEFLLKDILDIERYHRKLSLKILLPKEYAKLSQSYENILKIIELYEQDFMNKFGITIEHNDVEQYKKYLEEYKKIFNVDRMINYGLKHIEETFFNKGLYQQIDDIQDEIDKGKYFFNDLANKFSVWINEYENKTKKTKNNTNNKMQKNVNLIYQERQGNKQGDTKDGEYCITMTKRRGDILKQILTQKKMNGYKLETYNKSDIKLVSDEIKTMSTNLIFNMNQIDEMVRDKYMEHLDYFDDQYNFNNIAKFIGEIDVFKCLAKVAKSYGYVKPIINNFDNNKSYINAKDVRHPIVERLPLNTNYVANDVILSVSNDGNNGNNGYDGMLLYSQNSCGKSVYMKSAGLNVILAQMGSYVAAKSFEYYPYHHIFTRISGDDNIFYGQSSFAIEMNELRSILKYANKNSLVLGDEVCRGTETISGIALVASAVNKFCKNRINFIFATHLHKLYELDCIKQLKNLGIYHLTVDTSNGKLIYKRKLTEGPGDSIYGLEIAKYLVKDNEFIDYAYKIRTEILNLPDHIIQPKSSKYNNDIYIDRCQIKECNKTYKDEQLDVHHILFQSKCNENGLVEHVKKNDKSNLVVLCKEHHIQVHNKNLEIIGYKDTTNGVELDYKFLDTKEYDTKKKNRLKYTEDDIQIIKQYEGKPMTYVIKKLKEEHQINIGRTTLNKIFKDEYL